MDKREKIQTILFIIFVILVIIFYLAFGMEPGYASLY